MGGGGGRFSFLFVRSIQGRRPGGGRDGGAQGSPGGRRDGGGPGGAWPEGGDLAGGLGAVGGGEVVTGP